MSRNRSTIEPESWAASSGGRTRIEGEGARPGHGAIVSHSEGVIRMGGVLTLVSIVAGTASFIALFKPLPSIGLPTRQRAFGIWFASWVMLFIGAASLPESTSAGPTSALDCTNWNTEAYFEIATVESVMECVDAGAGLDAQTEDGFTPLHFAALLNSDPAVITTLLDAGADLSAQAEDGFTPLHFAALLNSNPAIVNALLDAGADLSAQTEESSTPLHIAAGYSDNPSVINALLDAGADLGAQNVRGCDNPAVITTLLDAGADLSAQAEDGFTPLHYAAATSDPDVVTALLDAGADLTARTARDSTPLHMAAVNNDDPAVITTLMDAGADLEGQECGRGDAVG